MKERTRDIFESALQSFIKTGRPITSESLFDGYDFGIKPAMIRWELNALADQGYFYQIHPSGGRFPTDKAYRYFVRELLDGEWDGTVTNARQVVKEFLEGERKKFVTEMAEYLNVLGVGFVPDEGEMYESGFNDLLRQLELKRKQDLLEVVKDFEYLRDRLTEEKKWWKHEKKWPQVFVGESPLTESDQLSLIVDRLDSGGEQFLLIAIGPKRMDYKKSLGLFWSIEKTLGL